MLGASQCSFIAHFESGGSWTIPTVLLFAYFSRNRHNNLIRQSKSLHFLPAAGRRFSLAQFASDRLEDGDGFLSTRGDGAAQRAAAD
jgi:hypothetical protein